MALGRVGSGGGLEATGAGPGRRAGRVVRLTSAGRSWEKDGGGAEAPGRLSRRRPPAGGGAPNCPPWFLLEGRKREPWAALLRSTVSGNVDLTPNIEPLPPLPAFPGQESLPDPETPELFIVGSKTFTWTPFPPAFGGSGNSYQLFHGTGGSLGSPTPSLKGYPPPDSRQTPSVEESVSVQDPPVLLNCPLCQKAFDPKLAQLDVDSHLAQCLAESTEDVVW